MRQLFNMYFCKVCGRYLFLEKEHTRWNKGIVCPYCLEGIVLPVRDDKNGSKVEIEHELL